MRRVLTGLALVLGLGTGVVLSSSCFGIGDIDRTNPDKVPKSTFFNDDGTPAAYYFRQTVIDVPATHNSGVDDFWPAWTDAISSSSDAKIRPPSDSMRVTFGCVMAPGRAARNTMTAMRPIPTVDSQRDRGDASQASTSDSSCRSEARSRPPE